MSLHNVLPQHGYRDLCAEVNAVNKAYRKEMGEADAQLVARGVSEGSLAKIRFEKRRALAAQFIKAQYRNILAKAGVYSSLGYNFYDLRAPVELSFPVNTPLRNKMPRVGRVNDGFGTAANWKATRNPGATYAGVAEGKRNAVGTPDENSYVATYKEVGVERAVTFTAQAAGEGYADNVADEHLRGLFSFELQEEGLILAGNSGTAAGNNGFALGTGPTPVGALAANGAITVGDYVSAYCVELTALGNPQNVQYGYSVFPTVSAGLTPSYTRTNADGTTDTINGGCGAVSAASNIVQTTSGHQSVTFTVTPSRGAFAWAWYVDIEATSTTSTANALLAAITTVPSYTAAAAPTGTQAANAAGLNADHSFNTLDFDGLLTYAAVSGTWTNMLGAGFTTAGGGVVNELDTILENIFVKYQARVQKMWADPFTRKQLTLAVMHSGGNANLRFNYERNEQGQVTGGALVTGYQSQYAIDEEDGGVIPIGTHPMMPPGTIYFELEDNPYPQSRAPFVAGMLTQRDYYSIEWPLTTRIWTFGTYAHEVLAHHFPWIPAVLTGIGAYNNG